MKTVAIEIWKKNLEKKYYERHLNNWAFENIWQTNMHEIFFFKIYIFLVPLILTFMLLFLYWSKLMKSTKLLLFYFCQTIKWKHFSSMQKFDEQFASYLFFIFEQKKESNIDERKLNNSFG